MYLWSSPLCAEMERAKAGADSEGNPTAPWWLPSNPSISAFVTGVFLEG